MGAGMGMGSGMALPGCGGMPGCGPMGGMNGTMGGVNGVAMGGLGAMGSAASNLVPNADVSFGQNSSPGMSMQGGAAPRAYGGAEGGSAPASGGSPSGARPPAVVSGKPVEGTLPRCTSTLEIDAQMSLGLWRRGQVTLAVGRHALSAHFRVTLTPFCRCGRLGWIYGTRWAHILLQCKDWRVNVGEADELICTFALLRWV
jgi:hypothetical protein